MDGRATAVIIVNWNGWRHTLRCLRSLRRYVSEGLARIFIVDNASSDDSLSHIRAWLLRHGAKFVEVAEDEPLPQEVQAREYVLISAGRNRGYAHGSNAGILAAIQFPETKYVLLLNNDTTLADGCLTHLLRCVQQDSTIGVVGPTLVEEGGRLLIAAGATYRPLLTVSRPVRAGRATMRGRLDYISGAALLTRVDVLKAVGLLAEDYFMYFEDLDFCQRVRKFGLRVAWCPEAVVYHRRGGSTGSRWGPFRRQRSPLVEYHSTLSCLAFTRKFYPRLLWAAAVVRLVLKVGQYVLLMRPRLIVPLLQAYRRFLKGCRSAEAGA